MISDLLQYFNIDKNPDNFHNDETNATQSSGTSYIPMLPIHNDPIQFLRNQEMALLEGRLPKLVDHHQKCLQSGDKNLIDSRMEILRLMQELVQSYDALNEIYLSEKYSKLAKYEMFVDWMDKKSGIANEINVITNNSHEGQTYKTLLVKSDQLSNQISKLESELKTLKNQKRLISHQILETKSLLDIKLNGLNDDLETLNETEKLEIDLMFKEKQIRSDSLSDKEVSDSLNSHINSLNLLINTTSETRSKFDQSKAYLSDVFDTLQKMEKSIKVFIQEMKTDNLGPLLLSNRDYLVNRLSEVKQLGLRNIETIIINELKAIEKALTILKIDIPKSPMPDRDNGKDRFHESTSSNVSKETNESSDYYPNMSSFDNISIVSSNRQSLHISNNKQNSVSASPPKVSETTTIAVGSSNTNPGNSNLGFFSNKNPKYKNLMNGIKNSKGEKTD